MRLAEVVAASRAVAGTAGRLEKIGHLADLLTRFRPTKSPIVIGVPERRAAPGPHEDRRRAALRDARRAARRRAVARHSRRRRGLRPARGAVRRRIRRARARSCCASCSAARRATSRIFCIRLLFGELRQGALEGVLMDAVARAVRHAGGAASAARRCSPAISRRSRGPRSSTATRRSRGSSCSRSSRCSRCSPTRRRRRRRAGDARRSVVRVQARWRAHPGPQGRRRGEGVLAQPARRDDRRAGGRRPSRARCRRARSSSTAKRSRCGRTAAPQPFQITMRRFGRKLDVDALAGGAADHAVLLRRAVSRRRRRWSTSR